MRYHRNPSDEDLAWVQPGDVIEYDFRYPQESHSYSLSSSSRSTVRVVQWNIERGYQHQKIVETLQRAVRQQESPAGGGVVALLQELDIFCERTEWRNEAKLIAQATHSQLVFVVEFAEFASPLRSHENRCGPHPDAPAHRKALHGNAILHTFPSHVVSLENVAVIPHTDGIHWPLEGERIKEPRDGFRSALRGELRLSPARTLLLYSLHFEVFCGALTRLRQLSDVMHDATSYITAASRNTNNKMENGHDDDSQRRSLPQLLSRFTVVIGGDLNTHAHGIVRLSPQYGTDRMKLLSLGECEATWMRRKVLTRPFSHPSAHPLDGPVVPLHRLPEAFWHAAITRNALVWKALYGIPLSTYQKLSNDVLCLWDPFDSYWDTTLNHPKYHGFAQGKLDWLLLSNVCAVVRATTFNDDYTASDHKGIVMDIEVDLEKGTSAASLYRPWRRGLLEWGWYWLSRLVLFLLVWKAWGSLL